MTLQTIKQPSDDFSHAAKVAALRALDALQSPDHRDLVWTTAHMEPDKLIALLFRCIGRFEVGEADRDEVRGALLMATAWISGASGTATQH